jgi:ribosomal protein L1
LFSILILLFQLGVVYEKQQKFDEAVRTFRRVMALDPKHADQMVRGTVVLPNGLGKSKKVLVIASGDKQQEAAQAGADFVGGEDMVQKIMRENWTDFDKQKEWVRISNPTQSSYKVVAQY